jgi:hypothetical protein
MLDRAEPAYKTKQTVDRTEMSTSMSLASYASLDKGRCPPQKISITPAISAASTGLSRWDRLT